MFFFYKHMKFRNQARLCLVVFDFEAHSMLSSCLTLHGTVPDCRYEKNLTPMWLLSVYVQYI